ncbi:hypothetical protein ISO99_06785 [Staphylococcus sp. 18_1_E_LY]|uniref:Phage protein n=1 Tax=Staphylococcus lloydii TaxID=2781774 RepID=A0A7T1F9I2_9STAP|nr:hypothetical protein [Staphylococcus lloydii]MBF7019616.1 hypothetical protein [Staphylococcus lloydii]MBF7027344.1 hypothetical protein [Staphylococcus lloydii]MDU9419022.1 hypothetical protein [Staphylococcus lloydii]QPM75008.1 hypothetical protein ISP08_11920 [Staphylococcus lloydii]
MARDIITTPLDLKNLENHNRNYKELYNLIDATDTRLSENMWDELRNANTMKMLEPVQTHEQLPAEAKEKSLITVIDEQKVYAYVHDEWQQFSEIDLDPFSPFKDELQTMINKHETKANQILSDTQTEHDKAVAKINDLTSDFNNNYQTKLDAFNQDYQTKSTQLKNDYQTYSSQIDTNTTNSLSDIDDAKNNALTKLDNFQNTDTSEWQKHKLTRDDGKTKALSDIDFGDTSQLDSLETGFYYVTTAENIPVGASSYNGFLAVYRRDTDEVKRIEFKPYDSTQTFIKRFYETWGEWEPVDGTKIELFTGSVTEPDEPINLNDDPRNYNYLVVDLNHIGGDDTVTTTCVKDYIAIRTFNLGNSASGATLIETTLKLDSDDPTVLNTDVHVRVETDTATGESYMPEILRIVGVK